MPDNQTTAGEHRLAIWFEDTGLAPDRAAPAMGARGLSRVWLNALLGTARILESHESDVGSSIVAGALVAVPVEAVNQFSLALHEACNLLGTIAWIRHYDDPNGGYREAWENFKPLRSGG